MITYSTHIQASTQAPVSRIIGSFHSTYISIYKYIIIYEYFLSLYIFLSNHIELLCLLVYYLTALTVKLHVKLHVTSVVTTNNIQTLCCTFLAFLGYLLGKMPSHKMSCVPFCWGLKEKKKSYYNNFKFTFLINNKTSVTNSWVKNDREVLNIVDGHRMTVNWQSGAIAKVTTTIPISG